MRIDTAKMRAILTAPIYLTARTDELQLEIAENCVALSCSRKEAQRMDLEKLLEFLAQVKSDRRKQLKQSGLPVNLIYYLWVDEQARQLRFNFINANHSKLPFGCALCRVESELDILTQFKQSCWPGAISLAELSECDSDDDDSVEFTLSVYWEELIR